MPPPNPLHAVSRIANIMGYSEKTKRMAIMLLEKERKVGGFAGREPNGLAAAALYVVGPLNGETISQSGIARAIGITEVTIRNRIKGLNESVVNKFVNSREIK